MDLNPVLKKMVSTSKASKAFGPYSQAVISGNLLFTSGQLSIDAETGQMVDGGIEEQAKQVLKTSLRLQKQQEQIFKTT